MDSKSAWLFSIMRVYMTVRMNFLPSSIYQDTKGSTKKSPIK